MSCGGRVYKGDTVTISVPFDVDDYSNLTITYTTIGGEKIVKTQEEVEIEDGFITYTFEPGELDLLPDGVIYYTIECEVNGVPNVDSTNTNLYLKTPAGYSGRTAEDIYQEGYEAGLEDCSGSTDCSSAVTEAYQSGITEGMAEQKVLLVSSAFTRNGTYTRENGWNEIEVDVPQLMPTEEKTLRLVQHVPGPWEVVASYPTIGMSKVTVEDDGYGSWKYDQGYQAGIAQCSGETPCDCSSAVTEAWGEGYSSGSTDGWNDGYETGWHSGYTMGLEDCSGCSEAGFVGIDSAWGGFETYHPLGTCPFSEFTVSDNGYGQYKYDQGYAEGLSSQCDLVPLGVVVHAGDSGVIDNITPDSAAGFSSVSVDARDYGAYLYTSGYNAGLYDCSATTCNLRPFDYQIYPSWDGYLSFSASQASLDGFSSVSIIDLGYGQAKYDEGYQAGIAQCSGSTDCSSAVTEAYESGVTVGYYDSTKLAYFNTPAWVETTNPQFLEVGDILDMVFVTGEMGDTLHLLGNLNSGYTELEYVGGPGIAIDYPNSGGLRITMFNADGFRHMWSPFYSVSPTICRFSGDTYHLIFKTTLPDNYGRMYMQVTLINESRFNDVYSASATGETIHFSSGATNPFVINGVYDENSGLYGEMNSELKIKSLKVYKPVGPHIGNPDLNRLNANLLYKDGQFFDVASGGEIGAYTYDNGEAIPYYLPSADDELYTIW